MPSLLIGKFNSVFLLGEGGVHFNTVNLIYFLQMYNHLSSIWWFKNMYGNSMLKMRARLLFHVMKKILHIYTLKPAAISMTCGNESYSSLELQLKQDSYLNIGHKFLGTKHLTSFVYSASKYLYKLSLSFMYVSIMHLLSVNIISK